MNPKLRILLIVVLLALPLLANAAYFKPLERAEDEARARSEAVWKIERQHRIDESGTVCTTRTGRKYHECYHYAGRNTETSLYEAVGRGLDACDTCQPYGSVELLQPLPEHVNDARSNMFGVGLLYVCGVLPISLWGYGKGAKYRRDKRIRDYPPIG